VSDSDANRASSADGWFEPLRYWVRVRVILPAFVTYMVLISLAAQDRPMASFRTLQNAIA